jgi:hypothetical protein
LTHERTANRDENFSRASRLTRRDPMRRGAFDASQIFSARTERGLENFVSHMTIAAHEKPPRPAMAGAIAKQRKSFDALRSEPRWLFALRISPRAL